jgi:hypothetical protein
MGQRYSVYFRIFESTRRKNLFFRKKSKKNKKVFCVIFEEDFPINSFHSMVPAQLGRQSMFSNRQTGCSWRGSPSSLPSFQCALTKKRIFFSLKSKTDKRGTTHLFQTIFQDQSMFQERNFSDPNFSKEKNLTSSVG